jgi:phospholipid transport system transporter-binding protein
MTVAVQVAASGEGRCVVTGPLTLESVLALWQLLKTGGLLHCARAADLSGVSDADSAGLALLLAWRGHCLAAGGALEFQGLPPRILALAQLTSAEAALGA